MGLFECSKVLDSSRAEFPARRIVSRRGRGREKGVLAEIWKSKSFDSGGFHSPWTRSSFNVVSKIRNSGLERKIHRDVSPQFRPKRYRSIYSAKEDSCFFAAV